MANVCRVFHKQEAYYQDLLPYAPNFGFVSELILCIHLSCEFTDLLDASSSWWIYWFIELHLFLILSFTELIWYIHRNLICERWFKKSIKLNRSIGGRIAHLQLTLWGWRKDGSNTRHTSFFDTQKLVSVQSISPFESLNFLSL